jgi:hypothetical protein
MSLRYSLRALNLLLITWLLSADATAQLACAGDGWPCPKGCVRAEFIKFDASCSNMGDGTCCIYLSAIYRCRTEPNCKGDDCGNTKEVVLIDRNRGSCLDVSVPPGTGMAWRCGDVEYRDNGTTNTGIILLPPQYCGGSVVVVFP